MEDGAGAAAAAAAPCLGVTGTALLPDGLASLSTASCRTLNKQQLAAHWCLAHAVPINNIARTHDVHFMYSAKAGRTEQQCAKECKRAGSVGLGSRLAQLCGNRLSILQEKGW